MVDVFHSVFGECYSQTACPKSLLILPMMVKNRPCPTLILVALALANWNGALLTLATHASLFQKLINVAILKTFKNRI